LRLHAAQAAIPIYSWGLSAPGAGRLAGFICRRAETPRVGLLASILGFGVTIAAAMILYRLAFSGVVWAIETAMGGKIGALEKLFLVFVLLFVFISVATRVGRNTRDWINDGRRVVRARPAP
jgi:hypothetical protein